MKTSLKTFAARNIFIPLLYKYWHVPVFKHYQILLETEKLPLERLLEIQKKKLTEIMRHAYLFIPYYRKALIEMGATIDDMNKPEMIHSFPVLTKKIIQDNFHDLFDPNTKRNEYVVEHSGGSTGQPTKVRRDLNARAAVHAATWRSNNWLGWKLGEPWIWLWGRLGITKSSWKTVCLNFYKTKATREIFFNVHGLDKKKSMKFADLMQSVKPTIIVGYTNAIYQLCHLSKEEGIHLPGLKGIATTAETLFPEQRILMEDVFGCKVYNRYASSEVGLIATECHEHHGLHIIMENIYLECIQEDGSPAPAGEAGKILVTDLNNRALPLIRYDLGDIGVLSSSSCNCGRPFPLLEKIEGRLSDVLILAKGRIVFPDDLAEIFYPIEEVEKFQVIQESHAKIKVLLVLNSGSKTDYLFKIINQHFKKALGKEVEAEIHLVEDIPILPSGKHRICISNIQHARNRTDA